MLPWGVEKTQEIYKKGNRIIVFLKGVNSMKETNTDEENVRQTRDTKTVNVTNLDIRKRHRNIV